MDNQKTDNKIQSHFSVVFLSNFFNHHQEPVARRLMELTNGSYRFIETMKMPEFIRHGGYKTYENCEYIIRSYKSEEEYAYAQNVINEADTVVYGLVDNMPLIKQRIKSGKLTIEYGERWLKRGWINILSPRLLKFLWYYHVHRVRPDACLCASGYAAKDFHKLKAYFGKCYKWGYFTEPEPCDIEAVLAQRRQHKVIKIMWVARMLKFKHPEVAIRAVKEIIDMGFKVKFDMYGEGPEFGKIQRLISTLGLDSIINLCGNIPNDEIMKQMKQHEIFLFTSNRGEGWGAVVNEAMSQGCLVIASKECGSAPILISHGQNGLIYKNNNLTDLVNQLKYALVNVVERENMSREAYRTINIDWSPGAAAKGLLQLIDFLKGKILAPPASGPASKDFGNP